MSGVDDVGKAAEQMVLSKDYSHILARVWVANLLTGTGAIWLLLNSSAAARAGLDWAARSLTLASHPEWTSVWFAAGIAGVVSVLSGAAKLHDRISHVLGLRQRFDVQYILKPLAEGAGIEVDDEVEAVIVRRRHILMERTFYEYTGDDRVTIGTHLVQSALDAWGWFWVCEEAAVVLLLVLLAALWFRACPVSLVLGTFATISSGVGYFAWRALPNKSRAEVDAIMASGERREAVRRVFLDAL
jgi:hypothetical protein